LSSQIFLQLMMMLAVAAAMISVGEIELTGGAV
jgi:hypothetical protein